MSKVSPEEKLVQKKELWVERTSEILNLGLEEAVSLLSIERSQGVRVNTLKATVEDVVREMQTLGWKGKSYKWIPEGFSIEIGKESLRDSKAIEEGRAYIQNAASWLAILTLDPQPGERVLDVCAAPGGKTAHIAALTNNGAEIMANDNSKPRLAKLRVNCQRLGADIERFTLYDAAYISKKLYGEEFDKILIDAPCSGEGMMSLNKDKDFETWSVAHIKRLQKLQKKIVGQAWQLLKPGGVLVYSTCTMAPEENEAVVDYALRALPGASLTEINYQPENRVPAVMKWNNKAFSSEICKCMRLKPSKNIHAFFVAKLQKGQEAADF